MQEYLKSISLDLSNSIIAARQLLGYKLSCKTSNGVTSGYIVETEAYREDDPASHSYHGLTKANSALFDSAGTVYVYFIYGLHNCVNIVTGKSGVGQAVLIRAIEPIDGINFMKSRRHISDVKQLTNGPAKLAQAFAIDKSMNGSNILNGPLYIEKGYIPKEIVVGKRIGIAKAIDKEWRFYIKDNQFVSKLAKNSS